MVGGVTRGVVDGGSQCKKFVDFLEEERNTGGLLVTDHLKLCVMNPWNLMTRRCQETTLEFLILESQTGHLSVSQLSGVFFL